MSKPELLWINRKFEFVLPPELYPDVIERLRGTPARLEELIDPIPEQDLTRKPESGWTIQENIGHLRMVDDLFDQRLTQYIEGGTELVGADMSNQRTSIADFNAQSINEVLAEFRRFRTRLVGRFEAVDPSLAARALQHPRLNKPMRLIDHAFFAAEHDDHHLAQITRLNKLFG